FAGSLSLGSSDRPAVLPARRHDGTDHRRRAGTVVWQRPILSRRQSVMSGAPAGTDALASNLFPSVGIDCEQLNLAFLPAQVRHTGFLEAVPHPDPHDQGEDFHPRILHRHLGKIGSATPTPPDGKVASIAPGNGKGLRVSAAGVKR